jgi:hypothetical protein
VTVPVGLRAIVYLRGVAALARAIHRTQRRLVGADNKRAQ